MGARRHRGFYSPTAVLLRRLWKCVPRATREERIFELENLLDEEDIEEADRVVIQDQLKRLANAELSDKDERQAWSVIGRRAGAALKSPSVVRVLEGLITAGLRNQLGI